MEPLQGNSGEKGEWIDDIDRLDRHQRQSDKTSGVYSCFYNSPGGGCHVEGYTALHHVTIKEGQTNCTL